MENEEEEIDIFCHLFLNIYGDRYNLRAMLDGT